MSIKSIELEHVGVDGEGEGEMGGRWLLLDVKALGSHPAIVGAMFVKTLS